MEELVGKEFDFYGVDNQVFKLDDIVYEALEDEADGYRSCLDSVVVKDPAEFILFRTPIARVRVEDSDNDPGDFEGLRLVDTVDGHVWLRLGTGNTSDYYPYFVFDYYPKAPKEQD